MSKIHYMRSDTKTLCGIAFLDVLDFTDKFKGVTCKKCLKTLNKKSDSTIYVHDRLMGLSGQTKKYKEKRYFELMIAFPEQKEMILKHKENE